MEVIDAGSDAIGLLPRLIDKFDWAGYTNNRGWAEAPAPD
jgi:hypothetical protein